MTIRVGSDIIAGLSSDQLATKANLNLDNSTVITNCITEIPQDIKLELNSGTLTLKAGSRVYVPNGFESDGTTPKFDAVIVENDLTFTSGTGWNTSPYMFYYDTNTSSLYQTLVSRSYSGSTAPTGNTYMAWYDTTNNTMKYTTNSGSTWTSGFSLPLGIVLNKTGNQFSSIDQVFNGFGYIGSTVFALPGVKGLIPNGRNEDGTLKSIEFTTSSVITSTNIYSYSGLLALNQSEFDASIYTNYNEKDNYYYNDSGEIYERCICGTFEKGTDGVITSFIPKIAFHALDCNDSSTISGWSMPSNRYVNLTLGASGTTYTAPANGWFGLNKNSGGSGKFIGIWTGGNYSNAIGMTSFATASQGLSICCPCRKGNSVQIDYSATGTTGLFRFYYAEGELNV